MFSIAVIVLMKVVVNVFKFCSIVDSFYVNREDKEEGRCPFYSWGQPRICTRSVFESACVGASPQQLFMNTIICLCLC